MQPSREDCVLRLFFSRRPNVYPVRLAFRGFSLFLFLAACRLIAFRIVLFSAFPEAVYEQQKLTHGGCYPYHLRLCVPGAESPIEVLHLGIALSADDGREIECRPDVYVSLLGDVTLRVYRSRLMRDRKSVV